MRAINTTIVAASTAAQSYVSSIEDAYNLFRVSVSAVVTGSGAAGTLQLQGSNDISTANNLPGLQAPTNFFNIGSSVSVSGSAATYAVPVASFSEICCRWVRCKYTSTATGVQTVKPVADVSGSLAGTYFLISDTSGNNYAIWFKVSGSGSAPSVSGYTNVEQDISTNASAATIGTALATTIGALNSSGSFTTSGTTTVQVTNQAAGPFQPMADGNTGFTFAVTTPSGNITMLFNGLGY
jgi:hypothetical protein